jgi:hypothetical protein
MREVGKLTTICEPIVLTVWDPQHRTTLWTSLACCRDSFNFYLFMMFVPRRKRTYGPPRPVTGITLLFIYIYIYIGDVRNSTGSTRTGLHGLLQR